MSNLHDLEPHQLTGPDWCRLVGEAAVDSFLQLVAARSSGPVTPEELADLAASFHADPALMADRYRALWAAGGWTRRTVDLPDRRSAPLQRLLVERFAHLLAPAGSSLTTLADSSPAIPRAAIPGIIAAIATMAPGELWDQARRRCIDIAAALRMREGSDFSWEHVQREPEVMQLVDDVRMAVLPYFADFAKRRRWFVAVVDRHQADHYGPDAAGRPVTHQTLLDESGFDRVFAAIYRDLATRLLDGAGRAELATRYGTAALAALARLLELLPLGKVPVSA